MKKKGCILMTSGNFNGISYSKKVIKQLGKQHKGKIMPVYLTFGGPRVGLVEIGETEDWGKTRVIKGKIELDKKIIKKFKDLHFDKIGIAPTLTYEKLDKKGKAEDIEFLNFALTPNPCSSLWMVFLK